MTIQERINVFRAQEVVIRNTAAPLLVRQVVERRARANEALIRVAARGGNVIAQAFVLERLKAAHAENCDGDSRCHSCTACYQRTGATRCDKNCPHTTLEDFDE